MNTNAVIALQSIADFAERIAAALETMAQPDHSPATVEALRIAAANTIHDDPKRPGEIGVVWIDRYKVRSDNTEGKSLMLDLYAMGWRHRGKYAHASIHQNLWDDPVKVPQAWVEAGLTDGASAAVPRARVLFQLSPNKRTGEGNPRIDVLTVEVPPPGGNLPPLPGEVVKRSNGNGAAPDAGGAFNWFSRGEVIRALCEELGVEPAEVKTLLETLQAQGMVSPDDSDESVIAVAYGGAEQPPAEADEAPAPESEAEKAPPQEEPAPEAEAEKAPPQEEPAAAPPTQAPAPAWDPKQIMAVQIAFKVNKEDAIEQLNAAYEADLIDRHDTPDRISAVLRSASEGVQDERAEGMFQRGAEFLDEQVGPAGAAAQAGLPGMADGAPRRTHYDYE